MCVCMCESACACARVRVHVSVCVRACVRVCDRGGRYDLKFISRYFPLSRRYRYYIAV